MGVAALCCLTACTTVIAGTGSAGRAGSSGSTHHSAPRRSSASPLRRVVQRGPLGDPVTADFCHGISMRAFARFGVARVHGWQTATTCYIDVYRYDDTYFQLNTWYEDDSDFYSGARRPHSLARGAAMYAFGVHGHDCERALELHEAIVLETHTYNVRGAVPASVLCAASSTLVRQQLAAFGRHRSPKRALASPSLTSFDPCELMTHGHVDTIPGLVNVFPAPIIEDAGCRAYNSQLLVTARIAFVDLGFLLSGRTTISLGHRLTVSSYSHGKACEAISVQHTTSDGRAHEILDVSVEDQHGTRRHVCGTAARVAAVMLSAARLR
jgi:hypothetical protein